ncbi:MAG: DUF5723 family protein [Chitinophagales bacterium]|nr:DUF5723 family protein [Chitinophagales bacterium]
MFRLPPLLLLFGIVCSTAQAQNYLGIRHSNYAGMLGAMFNPSTMVDARLPWDIHLGSFTISGDNNFLYIPKDSLKFLGFGRIVDLVKQKHFYTRFERSDPNQTYDMSVAAEGMGPSGYFTFGKGRHALGAHTAGRFYLVINDAPGHQGQQAYYENRDTTLYGLTLPDDDTKANTLGWFEYGLSYAQLLYHKNGHLVKGGLGIKYLHGVGGAYIKDVVGSYNIFDRKNLFYYNGTAEYGGIDYASYDPIKKYNDLIHGDGWGGSIGFTYERKRDSSEFTYEIDCKKLVDPNASQYKYRIGLSLIDVGKIKFDRNASTYRLQTDSSNWYDWPAVKFRSFDHFNRWVSYVIMGDSLSSYQNDHFTMALPAAVHLTADWNVHKNWYVNATVVKGFNHQSGQGVVHPDVYSVIPRYETQTVEVSMPLSLFSYHNLRPRIGLCARFGYFFIGGDAWGGILKLKDFEGADVYAGVHVFFNGRRLRDDDGDKVSNKKDSCLTQRGPCETHGCPDRDKDGVVDPKDECPDTPGPIALKGCPDRDGDGVVDKRDDCPDEPGLKELAGCPDRDGDGIADKNDECPDEPGPARFGGCPDRDGDGLPDPKDQCPDEPGPVALLGCPDRDGDGVLDKEDKCPDEPGPRENAGCPKRITDDELNRIRLASQAILFQTASAIIEPNVVGVLDVVAEIMKKHPGLKWSIEGHTDDVGSDVYNQDLSNRRAISVRDYLVRKGVPAEQLSTSGYGESRPTVPNTSAANRAKNRRVEIKLVE